MGVAVFFVISGFVIAASNSDQNLTAGYIGRFILRRSLRLDPPYWVTMMFVILFFSAPFYPEQILANMFYVHIILGQPGALNVAWTLCQEVQLYLFFILSMSLIQRAAPRFKMNVHTLGLLVLGGLAIYWARFAGQFMHGFFPPYWFQFFAGVLCYWIVVGKLHWSVLPAYVLMIAAVIERTIITLPTAATAGAVAATLVIARHHLTTLLDGPAWQFFGRISYSLYLTHVPVHEVLHRWMGQGVKLAVISAACSIVVAWLMYLLVERTSIRWSHAVSKTGPPAAPASAFIPTTG